MAGAGFKTFAASSVLTSTDVNTYLMQQAVMVFADAAARDAAITSPSEGMTVYLKDSDTVVRYSGSAWVSAFSVANGGTGATNVTDARNNLGVGLIPITPTSVGISAGSSSVTSNGRVAFAGTNYIDLRGVFSGTYYDYRINLTITAVSADTEYRLTFLTGTTPDAGNKQTAGYRYSTGGTSSVQNSGTFTYHFLSNADNVSFGGMATATIDLFLPNLDTFTSIHSRTLAMSAAGDTTAYLMDTRTNGGTQFDGVRIISSAGGSVMNGAIGVYAYQDGV